MEFWPGLQFNVEFWPVYISSIRGIATQEGVKIQQRDQNSTAKEGHNSTKNPLNIDPGSVFNWGVKILSYTGAKYNLAPILSEKIVRPGQKVPVPHEYQMDDALPLSQLSPESPAIQEHFPSTWSHVELATHEHDWAQSSP